MARRARAGFAVIPEHPFEFFEKIGIGTEMAEMLVAALGLLQHFRAHVDTVVAMESVALDIGGSNFFTPKDVLEGFLHRRCPGPG
jgi:hypothetical protein